MSFTGKEVAYGPQRHSLRGWTLPEHNQTSQFFVCLLYILTSFFNPCLAQTVTYDSSPSALAKDHQ